MKIIIQILIYGIFIGNIGYSAITDPNVSDQKYIDYAQEFSSVQKILVSYKDGVFGEGSCVVISPHWILTSAHIVDKSQLCLIKISDTHYRLSKVIINKDYDKSKTKADLALCYSPKEIVLDKYPELYKNNDEIGKICSIVGFGQTGNFNTGTKISDDKKRAGKNIIQSVNDDLLLFKITKQNKTELDVAITNGDSGGGMFINGKLAGINCCVLARDGNPNSDYDDECGFMRISNYYNWIYTTVNYLPGSE